MFIQQCINMYKWNLYDKYFYIVKSLPQLFEYFARWKNITNIYQQSQTRLISNVTFFYKNKLVKFINTNTRYLKFKCYKISVFFL